MMVQAADVHTGQAGLAEKEPMLEVLLRRLATAVEAVGTLSKKWWGSHRADLALDACGYLWSRESCCAPVCAQHRYKSGCWVCCPGD